MLTERIKELTEHLQTNKHDYMARRGLLQMVGRRRRLLRYIAQRDSKTYLDLIKNYLKGTDPRITRNHDQNDPARHRITPNQGRRKQPDL